MATKDICNDPLLTDEEKWKKLYGTEFYGNLPQYKRTQHEGHKWMPCPYDTLVAEDKTRVMLGLGAGDVVPDKVPHVDENGRSYYMATASQGVWGFRCTYSGCPYKLTHGTAYFYR